MFHLPLTSLAAQLGDIDIYLFDQLLKGRIRKGVTLLDAGCGTGRNIRYLMQAGVKAFGADSSEAAIAKVRAMAAEVAPATSAKNFVVSDLAALPFADEQFDVVLCSAVLHFAKDEMHFRGMVQELWRVLQPGGMLFCRLSTTIGMEGKLQQVGERLYQMPHGPAWFLADEKLLRELLATLGATMLEPLKTVLVEQDRSMTTLVLQKR
ncbi:class I SAM-dependent methyltransferase [Pontibacter actiniarum]|uniref:SAM-dependent methyltransferase n=1 Tax=Pontibacter actiniarum TaxID=323450 RepID=A0A1X9YRS2_9BACT|nr:class I SAM-dependent methyltransferase [Pontibacter actiniarum]ARS35541.1 SAM-dependent methyltransferase [Pontibacter actiniarum]